MMMHVEWWHWMILGMVLVLLELAIPAFFIIWFGLGAVVVGLAVLAVPSLAVSGQVVIWIIASIAFVVLWVKVFKAQVHRTRVGLSQGQFAGEVGLVTREIKPFQNGQVRFQKPILGSDVWEAMANEDIRSGERVDVLGVEGNILRVTPRK
jgi:membrane protein implicated in regulation of membrane protease activity